MFYWIDLIGPRPGDDALQHERLPQAPSRWYLTGFLVPSNAPDEQRGQESEEELDEPAEPLHGSDDSSTPDRGSGKRAFLPSSMGLSILVDEATRHLKVAVSWGDYAPDEGGREDCGASEGESVDGCDTPSQHRFAPWVRRPRAESVAIDLLDIQGDGKPVTFAVPDSGGLKVACLVRPTEMWTIDGSLNVRTVSLFVINRRPPLENDERQDAAHAFQVEMSVEVDRTLIPRRDPGGLDSEDWDERVADLHFRDVAEYAVGHNVSTHADIADGTCRRVRTEWMPQAGVERVEPSLIDHVEFGMEALGSLTGQVAAKQLLGPLVRQYRDWINSQRSATRDFNGRRRQVADELVRNAERAANRIQAGSRPAGRARCVGSVSHR